jgi:hypothetical protein
MCMTIVGKGDGIKRGSKGDQCFSCKRVGGGAQFFSRRLFFDCQYSIFAASFFFVKCLVRETDLSTNVFCAF